MGKSSTLREGGIERVEKGGKAFMKADDGGKPILRASPAVKALVRKGTSPVKRGKGS